MIERKSIETKSARNLKQGLLESISYDKEQIVANQETNETPKASVQSIAPTNSINIVTTDQNASVNSEDQKEKLAKSQRQANSKPKRDSEVATALIMR